ncbi:PAS domain-containing hybrid sensor histidine kinase/response regulator [Variovorax sp. HJSM1_2]|uniref:PAS domain-containing hybrid sensor histidine kinase/response regulator n=1 Tax=Variovorax sp. HJSM1_2 TaxID=3366263 RepID=UPI003BEE5E28
MTLHQTLSPQSLQDAHFRMMVDSLRGYAMVFVDINGLIIHWNDAACELYGYGANEVVGEPVALFYPAETQGTPASERELLRARETGRSEEEGWRVRRDGTRFWAHVVVSLLVAEDGAPIGFSHITRDLTERRKEEEMLRNSEERFRLLVEQVQDYAIFMIDPGGYIVSWNLGAQKNKGYEASEIIGKHFSVFYPPDVRAKGWPDEELRLARKEGRFEDEGWRVRKDGTRFWASVVITSLNDAAGIHRGFAKVTRDLTERRRVRALEDEGRRITTFLAMLGHELRNPLAPIANAVALLEREQDPSKVVRFAQEIIGRQLTQLTRLVDDLLDVGRITSGRIHLKAQAVDLAEVVRNAFEVVRPLAEQLAHHVEIIGQDQAVWVYGDSARLIQVVSNLLHNAVKFTPRGGEISVRISRLQSNAEILVKDNGPGIPPRDLQSVFDLFVQGTQDSARSFGGLGLGLSLVQQLVSRHGGNVSAFSSGRPGEGTEFLIQLPAVDAPKDFAERPAHALDAGNAVLVVDDNRDAADTLALVLENLGYQTQVTYNGGDALEILRTQPFAAVLLDLGLPDMSGVQVAEEIRKAVNHPPPLVAVTGYGQESDRAATSAAGFAEHLTKPVEVEVLHGLLKRLLQAQS